MQREIKTVIMVLDVSMLWTKPKVKKSRYFGEGENHPDQQEKHKPSGGTEGLKALTMEK